LGAAYNFFFRVSILDLTLVLILAAFLIAVLLIFYFGYFTTLIDLLIGCFLFLTTDFFFAASLVLMIV
jgi:hypothetical protein